MLRYRTSLSRGLPVRGGGCSARGTPVGGKGRVPPPSGMERLTHRQLEHLKARLLEGHREYLERRAAIERKEAAWDHMERKPTRPPLPPFRLKLRGQRAVLTAWGGALVVEMPAKALMEREALKRRGF